MVNRKKSPIHTLKEVDTGEGKARKRRRKKFKKSKKQTKVSDQKQTKNVPKIEIKQYIYKDKKRAYNPPVGLVSAKTDSKMTIERYSYDPHLDPQLQWTGKKEQSSFEVRTVPLHVHERIDPLTIIEKIKKKESDEPKQKTLFEFFDQPENNPPFREAVEFYEHELNWSNRLIAGDSLLVMNSLIHKESMEGKIQMIYIDPPYGKEYRSNFQPFVNKRQVDENDEGLSQEPETVKAYRDTWELGIHSYLTYFRDRLLLAHKLLNDTGSVFIQINDTSLGHIKEILDEIFLPENFCGIIIYKKTGWQTSNVIANLCDFILWYAKDIKQVKFRRLYKKAGMEEKNLSNAYIKFPDGTARKLNNEEIKNPSIIDPNGKLFESLSMTSTGSSSNPEKDYFEYNGKKYHPGPNQHWKNDPESLAKAGRLFTARNSLRFIKYLDDFPYTPFGNIWTDTVMGSFTEQKIYAVQTNPKVIQRCMLMTTTPGDIVFDPTCGSGTTAYVAARWGRRWITCDTSRVAITLTRQRLMTASFDYFKLKHPEEGVEGDFEYTRVEHITAGDIAKNEPFSYEDLYDQPIIDNTKLRITGPFTVEAVPSPVVKSFDEIEKQNIEIDSSISRKGETSRQEEWRDELLASGIKGKTGQKIEFSRIEPSSGTKWLQAIGETKGKQSYHAAISFGPEHSPLEQKQVELAFEEARTLVPQPSMMIFTAFQFDPEASKDIDKTNWPGVTILKVQMNTDLFTSDLKKKRSSNESFLLIGQPDVSIRKESGGKFVVEVNGFDYYNTKTGEVESGDVSKITMWMLDTDYDGRSLYPSQVFFPMEDSIFTWDKLGKNLKAELDPKLLEQYKRTTSLSFSKGDYERVAVKIIDDRGIESLKILDLEK